MTELNLPEPIAAHLVGDRQTPDAQDRCFTAQAFVTDEGRTHNGLAGGLSASLEITA